MLAEHKRLSLSDPVEAYVPGLTRGRYVTLREVLSHTSGYRDFWPQDYVPDFLQHATTPRQIADQWAGRALDFEPRTHWQYSNTNYVVAGLAVEKAGGEALYPFLQEHVFTPLGMHSVVNVDGHPLSQGDAEPFTRAALGPLRPAPPVAAGWQYGAIELGMTARDLAVWDISVLRQSLMTSDSYRLLERPVALSNGQSTHYGLGLWVEGSGAQRVLEHGGETSGFSAENRVYPAQHAAIVVLVNQDQTDAARILSDRLAIRLGLASAPPPSSTRDSQASRHVETTRRMLQALQRGQLDVRQLTADAQAYFTPQARSDYQTSLAALGSIGAIAADSPVYRGGFVYRGYETTLGHKAVDVSTLETPDGHLEQFLVIPEP
jgi:CubicO group peptidase (beta-lactamase class C family)